MQPLMREQLASVEHALRVQSAERRAPFLAELDREARRQKPRPRRRGFAVRLLAALPFRA